MNYELKEKQIKAEIGLINGDIMIEGGDRNDIELDFGDVRRNTAEEMYEISFDENVLSIKQVDKKLSQFMNLEEFPVTVKVPSDIRISGDLNNVKGDISVKGIEYFKGRCGSKKGDVTVKDINEADLSINVVSGDIDIKSVNGKIGTSSINGDVVLKDSKLKDLSTKTVSGDVAVDCEFDLERDLTVNTVTGDITLNLRKFDGDAGISVNSVSGDIEITGAKPADEKIKISQVKGEFAKFNKAFFQESFKPMLKNLKEHIKDMTKDISKHKIKSEVHSSQKENQNVKQILNMVSEGKISAEEAEKLLNALK